MNRPRIAGLLVALVVLLAFLPAMRNGFVNYDDDVYVTQNPAVQRGITFDSLHWAFAGFDANNGHPLTWISHMADVGMFRLNPAGHNFVSVFFHAINSALLFILLFRLTNRPWPSLMVAALFGLHPLHVESVAWISERKDVLSTFFALLTLLCYSSFAQKAEGRRQAPDVGNRSSASRPRSSISWYLASVFFFVCALLSKPMVVTLPFVMLLLDYWPLNRGSKRGVRTSAELLREKLPFFILSAIFCVVTFLAQRAHAMANVPVPLRLENACVAYVAYLMKTFWPFRLAVYYPLPATISFSTVVVSGAVLFLVSAITWMRRASEPYLLTGWLWFLGTLVPVIGLVQVGGQAMADRYTYFPLIGIFLAVCWWAAGLTGRFPALKTAAIALATVVLGGCLFLTVKQLDYWLDSEALFHRALAVGMDDPLVRLNLGSALEERGDISGAVEQYRRALELDPSRHEIYNNLGKLLAAQGRFEDALPYCRDAVRLAPKSPVAHFGLGVVLNRLGQPDAALAEFLEAVSLEPDYVPPHFRAGQILLGGGRYDTALAHFREALRLQPDNVAVLVVTARVLASADDPRARNGPEALALAQRAIRLQPDSASALDALALAWAENGRFSEAVDACQKAMRSGASLSPDEAVRLQDHLESFQRRQPWREARWKF